MTVRYYMLFLRRRDFRGVYPRVPTTQCHQGYTPKQSCTDHVPGVPLTTRHGGHVADGHLTRAGGAQDHPGRWPLAAGRAARPPRAGGQVAEGEGVGPARASAKNGGVAQTFYFLQNAPSHKIHYHHAHDIQIAALSAARDQGDRSCP